MNKKILFIIQNQNELRNKKIFNFFGINKIYSSPKKFNIIAKYNSPFVFGSDNDNLIYSYTCVRFIHEKDTMLP